MRTNDSLNLASRLGLQSGTAASTDVPSPGNRPTSHGRISTKVIAPMLLLVVISALVATLTLVQDRRTYGLLVAEKKSDLVRHSRTLYHKTRHDLIGVAGLVADNAVIQNGLLIYDQFDVLNTISGYLGHSGIDIISVYDLEGRSFARAHAPSYFGDRDELTPFILDLFATPGNGADADTVVGVTRYLDRPTLISARVIRGISGPAGAVVVGFEIDNEFLSGFVSERHAGLILALGSDVLVSTMAEANPGLQRSIHVVHEPGIRSDIPYEILLSTNDAEFLPGFWNAPLGILMIAGFASLGSVVLAFVFLFRTVVRPVRHLTAVAEQQVSGDLSARIRLGSRDELGRLGDILNLLTHKLQRTLQVQDRIIEERSRLNAELEQRVAERTQELQLELNERKRAQADLVRAKEEAEQANMSKSRFLAAASHDLRQPVHAMSLFISQLAEQAPSAKWSTMVRNVASCLESLREMFEKILDISKLEAGVVDPQIEDFPVSRLLDRLQREFGGLAAEKGIDLRTVRSTATVRTDPALLYRILGNLVCNSVRHTRNSRVVLGCRRIKGGIRIQVWDTGEGIPAQDIAHIFEEFYRASNTSSDDQGQSTRLGLGLGLGLSIVEHTAKLLKHPMRVSSTPGRHTVFSIEVPGGEPEGVSTDGRNAGVANIGVAGTTVLVVDDNAMALEALKSTLENWGCRVVAAGSAHDALRILSAQPRAFDVVVTDYLLENTQTGVGLIRSAEAVYGSHIPSIVLSGVSSRQMEQETRSGGYSLLYKPVPAALLRRALVECLQRDSGAHGQRRFSDLPPIKNDELGRSHELR